MAHADGSLPPQHQDIFNGHLKLILGLVWSLFRGIRLTELTGGSGEGGTLNLQFLYPPSDCWPPFAFPPFFFAIICSGALYVA